MNLQQYKLKKEHLLQQEPKYRELCLKCRQPNFSCYCSTIQKFDPQIKFVILIHPIEVRRRIATGRMAHLCLDRSHLIKGENYSENNEVNDIIEDPKNHSIVLYPGPLATNLTYLPTEQRLSIKPNGKDLVVFVIDGTWNTARKMISKSENIKALPRICFSPDKPSNFRVRKQPRAGCVSTIEAVHQTIELLGPTVDFSIKSREHDKLISVFESMIDLQIDFKKRSKEKTSYRLPDYKRSA